MTPKGAAQLQSDEGKRNFVYDDKTGVPLRLVSGGNPTIAYGRNLASRGLTDAECLVLFNNDINAITNSIYTQLPWAQNIPPVWLDVMIMVEYNTGDVFEFQEMLDCMENGDAQGASEQLLNSRAAMELPERYARMSNAILANAWQ